MTEQARSQLSTRHSQLNEVDAVTDRSEKQRNPAGEEMDRNHKHQVAEASAQYLADMAPQSTPEDDTCPPGYKRTEVGVIPEDWEILSINECSIKVGSGKTPTGGSSVYVDFGRPFIRSQNVGWGVLELSDVAFITDDVHNTFPGTEIKENDVLLNITGASIGRCAKADKRISGGNVNQHVCIIRLDKTKVVPEILVELINSSNGQCQIDSYQAGGNREGLNFSQVRELRFAVSKSKKEQTAIANALSDMDALISELEKLIAKKQAIKTATMQQLLTGRTRLPPFAFKESALREDGTHTNSSGTALLNEKGDAGTGGPKGEGQDGLRNGYKQSELGEIPEDWEVVTLAESTNCLDNLRVPLNERQRATMRGNIPYCGANGIVDWVNDYVLDDDIILIAEDGGYFDEYATRPIAYRMIGKCWVNNHAHILKAQDDFDQGYIFYCLVHKDIQKYLASGTRAKLNKSEMERIEVIAPLFKTEQTAIATILSDMDEEIQALQQRLAKTRQIKQGMMQELLTGKTRLVKPEQAA